MGDNVHVGKYKDLENIIDHKLKGNQNVSQIYKKCNQRLVVFSSLLLFICRHLTTSFMYND